MTFHSDSQPDRSTLEQQARTSWLTFAIAAGDVKYRHCDHCQRVRDEDGRPLLVARQPRARRFLCLACFDTPSERPKTPSRRPDDQSGGSVVLQHPETVAA